MRFHRLKFQMFRDTAQLVGKLPDSKVVLGEGQKLFSQHKAVSALMCTRKVDYYTSIPLYIHAASHVGLLLGREDRDEATAATTASIREKSQADRNYYFDVNEWTIVNRVRGVENTFTVHDTEILLDLQLWAEERFLLYVGLHEGLRGQDDIARSLCDASVQQFTNIEEMNNVQGAVSSSSSSSDGRKKGQRFDCICMVVCVQQPCDAASRAVLYVWDGSGPPYSDNGTHLPLRPIHYTPQEFPFLGPQSFRAMTERMHLSMKNSALFSECASVQQKRELESTLQSADEDIPAAATHPPNQVYGQLYRIECQSMAESNYLTEHLSLQAGMWVRLRALSTSNQTGGEGRPIPTVGVIAPETTVAILQPYFKYVFCLRVL